MMKPPELWPSIITPPVEVDFVKDLYANLWGVFHNVDAWNSAFQLFRYSQGRPIGVAPGLLRKWRFIAAHECVLQLHHFRERLILIRGHKVRACYSLRSEIDMAALRAATRKLDRYFPDIDSMRHAIAHSGANEVRPEEHAPDHGWLLTQLDEHALFKTYYQGKERSLELSEGTLHRVEEVATDFLLGFVRAAKSLEKQGHLE